MTVKDKVITTLQTKITGDGEILIREGDGITSIDPALVGSGPPDSIQNITDTAKVKVNTDDTVDITATDTAFSGSITVEDEIQINNSNMVFNNINESVVLTDISVDARINNGNRSYNVIVGKNCGNKLEPDDITGFGQSCTFLGTNAGAEAIDVCRSEFIGAAVAGVNLTAGDYVSIRGYHSGNRLSTANQLNLTGPFNCTRSDSATNSSISGVYNAEDADVDSTILTGFNNYVNATSLMQSGGLGLNLGVTAQTATNVWLYGSASDVRTANELNFANYNNAMFADLQKKRLAIGPVTNLDPQAKLHISNGSGVYGDLDSLARNPKVILGDNNKRSTISCSAKSIPGEINGHVILSSSNNDIVEDSVAINGSVTVGLTGYAGGEFRISTTFDGLAYTKLATVDNSGTLELHDISAGVILPSPDGTRWKLTVSNQGNLVITAA